MNKNKLGLAVTAATLSALMLAGCGGGSSGSDDDQVEQEVTREHDSRSFTVPENPTLESVGLEANEGAVAYVGTYEGIQGPAIYTAEFPLDGWNGGVLMYAHGYNGTGEALPPTQPHPSLRAAALSRGYAWAASSYSANYYDVRAAIEDTNKLALELRDYIERDWSADHGEITKRLIAGVSLGGHTAAAAVDRENIERARYQVNYAGAMPLCQAEQNQFQWLGDYNRVAQELAGQGDKPYEDFQDYLPQIIGTLFELDEDGNPTWKTKNTDAGNRLLAIATNLTGGDRPIFADYGFTNEMWQGAVLGTGGSDGTINGILAREIYDNIDRTYRWTDLEDPNAEEVAFNQDIGRVPADPGVNPVRDDGVRWLPEVNGDFSVPVLTMHTLGDFYVPFRHQLLYLDGAKENGNEDLLVQRAIRAPGHCDFTPEEWFVATSDFIKWVDEDEKPLGDDLNNLSNDDFGCAFTIDNPTAPDPRLAARKAMPDEVRDVCGS